MSASLKSFADMARKLAEPGCVRAPVHCEQCGIDLPTNQTKDIYPLCSTCLEAILETLTREHTL